MDMRNVTIKLSIYMRITGHPTALQDVQVAKGARSSWCSGKLVNFFYMDLLLFIQPLTRKFGQVAYLKGRLGNKT